MSFDLFLSCFRRDKEFGSVKQNILNVLRQHCDEGPDQFGFYRPTFADGSQVEFSAKRLEINGGCAFHIRWFSQDIISFVYDIARSGGMVIFNPQGEDSETNPTAILTDQSQIDDLPPDLKLRPIFCSSAEQLSLYLASGFDRWAEYRNQQV